MRKKVPLAEALHELRSELHKATATASGDRLRLVAESIEVELTVETASNASAQAEGKFWVLASAKGAFGLKRSGKHRVLLKLRPEWLDDEATEAKRAKAENSAAPRQKVGQLVLTDEGDYDPND